MFNHRLRKRSIKTARPSIPVPCLLALTCAVGIFLSAPIAAMLGSSALLFAVLVGALASVGMVVFAVVSKRSSVCWMVIFVFLGILLGTLELASLDHERQSAPSSNELYTFTLSEDSRKSTFGSRVVATVSEGPCAGWSVLLFSSGTEQLYAGEQVTCETRLEAPGDEYRAYYDQRGIAVSADLSNYTVSENTSVLGPVHQLRERLLNILGSDGDERTFLRAVLLGERSGLFEAEFYHSIKVAGLAHLVAVSGAHLVIVTGFITIILKRIRVSSKVSVALQTLFLIMYLALVGFPISCIRAAIMSAIALMALLTHRRSSSLTALGITTLIMMASDPSVVHQLSFQLSVAATFGIVLFMPLFNEWIAHLVPKLPEFVRESVGMTLAALVFSLPISMARFSMVPLLSPLANLVATPYLTLLLMCGFSSLLLCSVAPFLFNALDVLTSGLIGIFAWIERIPFASIPVSTTIELALPLTFSIALLIWVGWPTPRYREVEPGLEGITAQARYERRRRVTRTRIAGAGAALVLVALVVVCARMAPMGERIVMLDVGQGDSFALMSEGKTLLVDTGNEPAMLYAALARNRIDRIDTVLITHPDDDHCGSLVELPGVVNVGQVLIAQGLASVESDKVQDFMGEVERVVGAEGIVEVDAGDAIRFGAFTLDIVAPAAIEHEGGNEDSICFIARVDCDKDGVQDWSAFFCGDAEAEVLESLNAQHLLEDVDIYKVGHHGSRKALTSELARVLMPEVSLIGVGKNSYGHPTEETLSTLAETGSRIYRSDECGDVVCSFTSDALELSTERRGA